MIVYFSFLVIKYNITSIVLILKPLNGENVESPLHIRILTLAFIFLPSQNGQELFFGISKKTNYLKTSFIWKLRLWELWSEKSEIKIYGVNSSICIFNTKISDLLVCKLTRCRFEVQKFLLGILPSSLFVQTEHKEWSRQAASDKQSSLASFNQ